MTSFDDVGSSKSACRRRHRQALDKKYRRLRKAGRVPQHTQAERQREVAELAHWREAEKHRESWRRRLALPLTVAAGGAAATFVVVTTSGVALGPQMHHAWPTAAIQPYYPLPASNPDHPDPPHTPESPETLYTQWYGGGTASTTVRVAPEPGGLWNSWDWVTATG